MQSLFDAIGHFLSTLFNLAQGGFDGINGVVGLLIALVAALIMPAWNRLFPTAFAAAVVFVLVGVLLPVIQGGAFVLPPLMTLTFWMMLLGYFLGFAVVIAVFFLVKSLFTGGRGHARHAH